MPPFVDPLWVQGSADSPNWYGTSDFQSSPDWQTGYFYGAPAAIVEATPIPEPSALALAALGAGLLLLAARRR